MRKSSTRHVGSAPKSRTNNARKICSVQSSGLRPNTGFSSCPNYRTNNSLEGSFGRDLNRQP
eukprot:8420162-Pyramimonas_sp.AAC.1